MKKTTSQIIHWLTVPKQPAHVVTEDARSLLLETSAPVTIPHWRDLHTLVEVSIINTPLDTYWYKSSSHNSLTYLPASEILQSTVYPQSVEALSTASASCGSKRLWRFKFEKPRSRWNMCWSSPSPLFIPSPANNQSKTTADVLGDVFTKPQECISPK